LIITIVIAIFAGMFFGAVALGVIHRWLCLTLETLMISGLLVIDYQSKLPYFLEHCLLCYV
jgi:hypothetical protein